MLSAVDLLYYAMTRPGARCLVVGPSLDQAGIYFDYFRQWAADCPLVESFVEKDRFSPFDEIKLINGSVITSRSAARGGRFIRGRAYHRCVITEAGFVPDDVYYAAIRPTLLQNPKAILDLEGTPWSKSSFFYHLFVKGLADGRYHSSARATVFDAPHISPKEVQHIRSEVPESYFNTEFLAEFPDDDEAVFHRDVVLSATQDYRITALPEPGRFYSIGVDVAKKRDYTVIVVMDISEKPYRIVEYHRFKSRLYSQVAELVNALRRKYSGRVVVDGTGVGEAVAERVEPCESLTITRKTKQELISGLLLALETRSLLLPSSWTQLLQELKHFRKDDGAGQAEPGYHDDCVMALALALWAGRRSRGWSVWRTGTG